MAVSVLTFSYGVKVPTAIYGPLTTTQIQQILHGILQVVLKHSGSSDLTLTLIHAF